jgi:transcriptional regulator with XRE-family HTH domain
MPNERTKEVLRFIAANVRRLRARRELTQEQLAEKAELDIRYLQKIEAASIHFNVGVLVILADALEVKPGILLRRAELPEPVRGRPPARNCRKKRTQA